MSRILVFLSVLFFVVACNGQSQSEAAKANDLRAEAVSKDNPGGAESHCVDPARVDRERMCTMNYLPVCGCDGNTYSNSCVASSNGLLKWEDGECPAND